MGPPQPVVLYTIGHSNHPLETFIGLLRRHGIRTVADVRSAPYSQYTPHFNRERLDADLRQAGIGYAYLGGELGGRPDVSPGGRDAAVDFTALAATPTFRAGLDRLREMSRASCVAVLCAEKDPVNCHRMILVARALRGPDVAIRHILADGAVETNEAAERRLARTLDVGPTLFTLDKSDDELVNDAYDLQGRRIAGRPEAREDAPAARGAG